MLKSIEGVEFMEHAHPLKSLAPRDIVARAIDSEMKKSGADYVLLDITHKPARFIIDRFPNIYQTCLGYGIDITKEPIPVVPAAHYQCGGVLTNVDGETEIAGLYAVGEVACTGLHGANRLASNSLLEALVCAHRAAQRAVREPAQARRLQDPSLAFRQRAVTRTKWWSCRTTGTKSAASCGTTWASCAPTSGCSAPRSASPTCRSEIQEYYWDFIVTSDLLELRNIATVAELIVASALRRPESRGLNYNLDYPNAEPGVGATDTVLRKTP